MSLAAFGIIHRRYQELASPLQMLSVMVWLLSCLFGASQLLEPSVQSSGTSYLSHGSSWLHPPILVASVRHASSASAQSSPCGVVPFWWVWPSPSQVHHLRSVAELCIIFIIILVFPLLLIFGTSKITQIVSDSIQYHIESCFRFCGCWSCVLNIPHMILLLNNRSLCILNSVSYHCGLSIHIILDPFLFVFIDSEVRFQSFLRLKLLFGSQAAECCQHSDHFCLQAALAFIRLMTLSCGFLCWLTIFARRKWQNLLFGTMDHCILCWPGCWARCWIWQDMDHMEASCVLYVKVGRFHLLEQSKISVLTVTSLGILMLTLH